MHEGAGSERLLNNYLSCYQYSKQLNMNKWLINHRPLLHLHRCSLILPIYRITLFSFEKNEIFSHYDWQMWWYPTLSVFLQVEILIISCYLLYNTFLVIDTSIYFKYDYNVLKNRHTATSVSIIIGSFL